MKFKYHTHSYLNPVSKDQLLASYFSPPLSHLSVLSQCPFNHPSLCCCFRKVTRQYFPWNAALRVTGELYKKFRLYYRHHVVFNTVCCKGNNCTCKLSRGNTNHCFPHKKQVNVKCTRPQDHSASALFFLKGMFFYVSSSQSPNNIKEKFLFLLTYSHPVHVPSQPRIPIGQCPSVYLQNAITIYPSVMSLPIQWYREKRQGDGKKIQNLQAKAIAQQRFGTRA